MIPKIIHYCWFGRGKLPETAINCIDSWRKYLPDYQIKEWNEDTFNLNSNEYVKEAYQAKKFAFVTDYVRLYVLYTEGGIYMDTDVEVLKNLDQFLVHHAFSGFETDRLVPTGIMASEKNGIWAKENLDYYTQRHFILKNGHLDMTTNVTIITKYMISKGLKQNNTYQDFPDLITLYPKDYFCPKSHDTGKITCTENTYTIHHFASSWYGPREKFIRFCYKLLGKKLGPYLKDIYKRLKNES